MREHREPEISRNQGKKSSYPKWIFEKIRVLSLDLGILISELGLWNLSEFELVLVLGLYCLCSDT